ncbi:hypothetical protein CROQUDRAFT_25931, partial [Cronartium quercuum f. sp. fusiforme G11]
MDSTNRARFEPKITRYTDIGPEIQDLPAKLWGAVVDYHASRSAELRLLDSNLFQLNSDY